MNPLRMAPKITSSSPVVMMPPRISRLVQVAISESNVRAIFANKSAADDVKDIYKRLQGKDLVIEERGGNVSEK